MIYIEPPVQFGGLLSPVKKAMGWIAGKGNVPGTPETRKYGYDRSDVADAAVGQLYDQATADHQRNQMILGGLAAVGLLALFMRKKRRG